MGVRALFRVKKAEATQLFRFIAQIDIKFNPWSGHDLASTREFWRSVSSARLRKANPKCIINVDTPNQSIEPSIKIKYNDGSEQLFKPMGLDVVEIMSDIHQHAYVLNANLEDAGKSLDDA